MEEMDENSDKVAIRKGLHSIRKNPLTKQYCFLGLDVSNSKLSDISILQTYKNLQILNVSNQNITSLNFIKSMSLLTELDASHNCIECCFEYDKPDDPEGYLLFPSMLTILNLSFNQIAQIQNLSNHQYLKSVDLSHNCLLSSKGFTGLRYLSSLNLSHNRIEDIGDLDHLSLVQLNLENNRIQSLGRFEDFLLLSELNISNNYIDCLHSLQNLKSLVTVNIKSNQVKSIDEIQNLKELKYLAYLVLSENPCNDSSYRSQTIIQLPNLISLDETPVTPEERIIGAIKLGIASELGWT